MRKPDTICLAESMRGPAAMIPQDMAALAHFMKEVESLEGNALLDRWIAQRDTADRSELEMQKELYSGNRLGREIRPDKVA